MNASSFFGKLETRECSRLHQRPWRDPLHSAECWPTCTCMLVRGLAPHGLAAECNIAIENGIAPTQGHACCWSGCILACTERPACGLALQELLSKHWCTGAASGTLAGTHLMSRCMMLLVCRYARPRAMSFAINLPLQHKAGSSCASRGQQHAEPDAGCPCRMVCSLRA